MDLRGAYSRHPRLSEAGIVFKDITPLLANGPVLRWTIDHLRERYTGSVDMVLGIESRGFIIGAALAYAMGVGLALVRKRGSCRIVPTGRSMSWSTEATHWRSIRTRSAIRCGSC
jgi:adenine phosphoribosyltransferase